MLENENRIKLQQYIDKLIKAISADAQKVINSSLTDKQIVDTVIGITVNKLTPESKMILSSVYNMMMEKTLQEEFFSEIKNKSAFYERDILKDLTAKFNFETPNTINYEESKAEINKWISSGAIAVAGGVVSISLKSWLPIGIAIILAGIMFLVLKSVEKHGSNNIQTLIDEYLSNVKQSLLVWICSVEEYYDEQVAQLKEGSNL